jgi:hypothetical protein
MPGHDSGYKKQESPLELSVFLPAMQNASPLLAVTRTGASASATAAVASDHRVGGVATRARARASAAMAPAPTPTTTCNGFRRVDSIGCELIKY